MKSLLLGKARLGVALVVAGLGVISTVAGAAECRVVAAAILPVTMQGLRASVPLKVNGQDTTFWLDSGAFFSIMPRAKAQELGLKLQPLPEWFHTRGIGGEFSSQLTTVKNFGIAGSEVHNIDFVVGGSDSGNGLIGRNILSLADTEFDLAGGSVKLVRTKGCDKAVMTYWAPGKPAFEAPLIPDRDSRVPAFQAWVTINGARVRGEFDSGASTSLLSRGAAERAGINLSDPTVKQISGIGGFGRHFERGWIVPVAEFKIGEEQVLRTHLTVIDGAIIEGDDVDMLIGADFMMAHHLYFARGQGKLYFTYTDGKPFRTEDSWRQPLQRAAAAAVPTGLHAVEAVASVGGEPKTADEFSRRGNARLTQGKVAEAIADLSQAIALSPGTASYYQSRARAYFRNEQPRLARADVERVLALDPRNGEMLRLRAAMRLGQHDTAGALADAQAAAAVTPASSMDAADVAALFERLHRPDLGLPLYDAVVAAHREDSRLGMLLNGRCWARALSNVELDRALDDCNRAIKRDGAKAAYLDSRGLVHFRKGELDAAIADYDAALKQAPDLAWSQYMRGAAKIALGRGEEGKADQTAAVKIAPRIAEDVAAYGFAGATSPVAKP